MKPPQNTISEKDQQKINNLKKTKSILKPAKNKEYENTHKNRLQSDFSSNLLNSHTKKLQNQEVPKYHIAKKKKEKSKKSMSKIKIKTILALASSSISESLVTELGTLKLTTIQNIFESIKTEKTLKKLSCIVQKKTTYKNFKKYKFQWISALFRKLNYKSYYLNRRRKSTFKKKYWRRFKKISRLQKMFNVEWPSSNPFKPWFIRLPNSVTRDEWLKERYETWKDFLKNSYYSFLQTGYGNILLTGHKLLFSRNVFSFSRQTHFWQIYSHIKRSWQYENIRHSRKISELNMPVQNSFQ
jgi:hypothetical protein